MSELQLGLIIVGALVVVAVVVYNKLQERSAQRGAEQAFRSGHADVLMGPAGEGAEPAARATEARHRTPALAQGESIPDAKLDYVMELRSASVTIGAELVEQWAAIARRLRERALLAPLDDGGYAAALQLVSREGVSGEADLIEFRSEVEALAARLGLHASAPEMKSALEAARALDAFCADRDIQVALHVVTGAPEGFDRAAMTRVCERFGLVGTPDGGLSSIDSAGRELFRITDRSGARLDAPAAQAPLLALTLTMDVPRVPDTQRSFEAMARTASSLGTELGGTVVDDNAAALDERSLAAIAAQLDQVRAELDARGFEPGGALARRLFS